MRIWALFFALKQKYEPVSFESFMWEQRILAYLHARNLFAIQTTVKCYVAQTHRFANSVKVSFPEVSNAFNTQLFKPTLNLLISSSDQNLIFSYSITAYSSWE